VTIPKEIKTDKDFLERLKQGAIEKLKELEAKKRKNFNFFEGGEVSP